MQVFLLAPLLAAVVAAIAEHVTSLVLLGENWPLLKVAFTLSRMLVSVPVEALASTTIVNLFPVVPPEPPVVHFGSVLGSGRVLH